MTDLHKMTLRELQELKGQVDSMIQLQQPSLRVGQICTVDSDKVRGMIGEIIKVNRTKCKIIFKGQANTWNVPKNMIVLGHPDGMGMQC
jgi:hypothetical protein